MLWFDKSNNTRNKLPGQKLQRYCWFHYLSCFLFKRKEIQNPDLQFDDYKLQFKTNLQSFPLD